MCMVVQRSLRVATVICTQTTEWTSRTAIQHNPEAYSISRFDRAEVFVIVDRTEFALRTIVLRSKQDGMCNYSGVNARQGSLNLQAQRCRRDVYENETVRVYLATGG